MFFKGKSLFFLIQNEKVLLITEIRNKNKKTNQLLKKKIGKNQVKRS